MENGAVIQHQQPRAESGTIPHPRFDFGEGKKSRREGEIEESVVLVENFNLWYGKSQALKNINLAFPKNRVTAMIGPSG
ncbi:MAG: hypothetical protein L6Q71_07015, partial [Planctomycetes bacterium]|nr:hypothetical protein [Planctomycetota bacterium]